MIVITTTQADKVVRCHVSTVQAVVTLPTMSHMSSFHFYFQHKTISNRASACSSLACVTSLLAEYKIKTLPPLSFLTCGLTVSLCPLQSFRAPSCSASTPPTPPPPSSSRKSMEHQEGRHVACTLRTCTCVCMLPQRWSTYPPPTTHCPLLPRSGGTSVRSSIRRPTSLHPLYFWFSQQLGFWIEIRIRPL